MKLSFLQNHIIVLSLLFVIIKIAEMLTTGKKLMNNVPPIPSKKKKGKETRTTRKRSERISENKQERMNISVHDDLIGGIRKKKRKMKEMDIELEKEEKEEKDLRFDQRMRDLISYSHHQEERGSDYEESIMNLSSASSEKMKKKKVDPNLNDHQYKRVFFGQEQKFIMF